MLVELVRAVTRRRASRWVGRAALELSLVTSLWLLYELGRMAAGHQDARAVADARWVHSTEQLLRLPSEAAIQGALTGLPLLYEAANTWYFYLHFPVTVAFLAYGFVLRPRVEYLWARNLLAVQTFLALVLIVSFPLAPPRMFGQWGFVDTMAAYGPDAYAGRAATVANQFAAMPSLHVGWALLIAVVVTRTGPRWVAWLAGSYTATTTAVVIVTANHWWLDAVTAVLLLGLALVLFPQPGRSRFRPSRRGCPSPGSPGT
jgi:hypothetical protein